MRCWHCSRCITSSTCCRKNRHRQLHLLARRAVHPAANARARLPAHAAGHAHRRPARLKPAFVQQRAGGDENQRLAHFPLHRHDCAIQLHLRSDYRALGRMDCAAAKQLCRQYEIHRAFGAAFQHPQRRVDQTTRQHGLYRLHAARQNPAGHFHLALHSAIPADRSHSRRKSRDARPNMAAAKCAKQQNHRRARHRPKSSLHATGT